MARQLIPCGKYASYLVSKEPVYDELILEDVNPTNAEWLGYYRTRQWEAYTGAEHTYDRVHGVYPNTTAAWHQETSAPCEGNPCDPEENLIGWGWSRESYGLESQSWASPILCFDEIMYLTQAV